MNYEENYEKNIMINSIKLIAKIFKWLFLIFAGISVALTLSFIFLSIFKEETLDTNGLANMMSLMTYYRDNDAINLIEKIGKTKAFFGTLLYGFISSITYIILYMITSNFIRFFKNIDSNKIFKDESLKILKNSIPLGVLVTLTQPVGICIINYTTGMFKYEDFNISGIIILFAIYVLKLIIENGNTLLKEKEKCARDLSKSACLVSDMKIDQIKANEAKKIQEKKNKKKKAIKR